MRTKIKRFIKSLIDSDSSFTKNSRQPFFDTDYYLETNIDIFIKKLNPIEHFIRHGQFENRDPARTISADWIQYKYSNLTDNPYLLLCESYEKGIHLSPSPIFDADFYLEQIGNSADLENLTAYEHFLEFGLNNKLRPNKWLDLEEFSKSNPWFFDSAKSELQKFVNLFDLVRSNQFFNQYLCFTLTDLNGHNYQLTEELLEEYLILNNQIPRNSDKSQMSNWQIIDVLQEIGKSEFERVNNLPKVISYPPTLVDSFSRPFQNDELLDNYVFYCHWDSTQHVETWIEKTLLEYKRLGFKVIFSTNVEKEHLPKFVYDLASNVLVRSNSGHDFESHLLTWRWAKENGLKIKNLLLTNDSIIFPVGSTESIENELRKNNSKVWALTANTSTKFHIQSFFIVLQDEFANRFMDWIKLELLNWSYISKMGLITRIELQINTFAKLSGFEPNYFFVGLDPTFNSWDKLKDFGAPIIKVNLLRKLISGYPGDTQLLNEKLSATFPESKIPISEMISYARKLEITRNPSPYWFNEQ